MLQCEPVGLPSIAFIFLFVPGFYPCLTTFKSLQFQLVTQQVLSAKRQDTLDKSVRPKTQITVESVCEQTDWGATEIVLGPIMGIVVFFESLLAQVCLLVCEPFVHGIYLCDIWRRHKIHFPVLNLLLVWAGLSRTRTQSPDPLHHQPTQLGAAPTGNITQV